MAIQVQSHYNVTFCNSELNLLTNYLIKFSSTHNSPEQDVQTNDPMVTFTYVGPLWWQSKQYLLAGNDTCFRRTVNLYSSTFFLMGVSISVSYCWNLIPTATVGSTLRVDTVSRELIDYWAGVTFLRGPLTGMCVFFFNWQLDYSLGTTEEELNRKKKFNSTTLAEIWNSTNWNQLVWT